MNEISKRVKIQYEQFPYPAFSWLTKIRKQSLHHSTYERGARFLNLKNGSHHGKKIALVGCGTTEALAFGSTQPGAEITAIDLSNRAITYSKFRCKLAGIKNINFIESDLLDLNGTVIGKFDYVHCYGVVHHLQNPQEGFKAIADLLAPQGFAKIMVYSTAARVRISLLQKVFKLLEIDFRGKSFESDVKRLMKTLPLENPLRLAYEMHPEIKTKAGLVDAFLHANENTFTLESLISQLEVAGLTLKAWDFSENILSLLKEAPGKTTIEKIEFLEAFDQWPGPFTFWVTK